MSDTPKTDARIVELGGYYGNTVSADFARELERENNQLRAQKPLI